MDDLLDVGNTDNNNNYSPNTLPNATACLVLGIISIVGCLFYGIPGLICGIITVVLHKRDKQFYLSNRAKYEQSYKTSQAGNICGIIGLSLSALVVFIFLLYVIFAVSVFSSLMGNGAFR